MRVRALDASGDMQFGHGSADFYLNSAAGVAQCILTRLWLFKGEWFLDTTQGTDWYGKILGRHRAGSYDGEIKRVILGTQGVAQIIAYSSSLDNRRLTIGTTVETIYSGQTLTLSGPISNGSYVDRNGYFDSFAILINGVLLQINPTL